MFRNKQSKFAFSCPGSQRPCLAALPIDVLTRRGCEMQNRLLHRGCEGSRAALSRGAGGFIVMQINVTIKNIILGDVSGVITHMAPSQLNSR